MIMARNGTKRHDHVLRDMIDPMGDKLGRLGSNQDLPDSKSGGLPITPRPTAPTPVLSLAAATTRIEIATARPAVFVPSPHGY